MYLAVPDGDKDRFRQSAQNPKQLKFYTSLTFQGVPGVRFRATANYGGKPWFDYAWLRCEEGFPGAELDPNDDSTPQNYRALAKIWGFTKRRGVVYAFVEYFSHLPRSDLNPHSHPIFRRYRRTADPDLGYGRVQFYAEVCTSTVGTACVFPDPDNEGAVTAVLYVPPFVEVVQKDGRSSDVRCPGTPKLPKPDEEALEALHKTDDGVTQAEGEEELDPDRLELREALPQFGVQRGLAVE